MRIVKQEFYQLPEYAVCYLEYGDDSGLSEEDVRNIDAWRDSLECDESPYSPSFDYGENRYFTSYPAFGLPCDCIDLTVTWLAD